MAGATRLLEAMLDDDEFAGALDRRIQAVVGSTFSATPYDDSAAAEAFADALGENWQEIVPECELVELMRWRIGVGVGIATIDWSADWTPRIRTLSPEYLWRDDDSGEWQFTARDGTHTVTPGDGKWILLTDGVEQGWRRAIVRRLAVTWLTKQYALRDWNRYNEKHGLPIVKAMVPVSVDAAEIERFSADVRRLNSEGVATLPTGMDDNGLGFDLELLEAKDQSWETFQSLVERCDRKININLVGSHLQSEQVDNGARAAAETHRGVSQMVAQADAEALSTDLRKQLVMPYADVHGEPSELAPWPHWETSPEEDAVETYDAMISLGKGLAGLKSAGYAVTNAIEIGGKIGVELEDAPEPEPAEEPEPDDEEEEEPEAMTSLAQARPVDAYAEGTAYSLRLEDAAADTVGELLSAERAAQIQAAEGAGGGQRSVDAAAEAFADADSSAIEEAFLGLLILQALAGRRSAVLGPGTAFPPGVDLLGWREDVGLLTDGVMSRREYELLLADARRRAVKAATYARAAGANGVIRAIRNERIGDLPTGLSGANHVRPPSVSQFTGQRALASYDADAWQYDAVLDDRTTHLCRSLDGLVMHPSDPRWSSRMPPLHAGCRSGIRAISAADAERAGYTDPPYDMQAEPGWGAFEEYSPPLSNYESELHGPILDSLGV